MAREEALKELDSLLIPRDGEQDKLADAFEMAIKALEQEPNTWSLDDAREDFMHDVYNTLDFLPTNDEANRIIDIFDRVTSSIEQEPIIDKIRAEIAEKIVKRPCFDFEDMERNRNDAFLEVLDIIDKYKAKK